MDASYAFSKFMHDIRYDDIPHDVIELVKNDLLDMTGNILAGSSHEIVDIMHDMLQPYCNAQEATIAVYGESVPVAVAAMLNADMAIARDFEDMDEHAHCHPGPVLAPVALTMAEYCSPVSGKDLITAYAGALEVYTRLCKYMAKRNPTQMMGGWDYAIIHGYFSAALFSAKLLKLSEEQIHHAMGIVFNQLSGSTMNTKEPSTSKVCGPGFAASAGVFAALLAQKGVTGPRNFINEHEISLAYQYHAGCDADRLVDGLGETWNVFGLGFKAYPGCRLLHRQIDATLHLVKENDIAPEEVLGVEYSVCRLLGDKITMTPDHLEPPNAIAAGFSIPWGIACAVARRRVTLAELEEGALVDSGIRDLAKKCHGYVDESLEDENAPALLRIQTVRGAFETTTGFAYGSPENPMRKKDLEEKFCANARMARGGGIPKRTIDDYLGLFERLEDLEDASRLLTLSSQ